MLLGSSILPSITYIGDKPIQLGDFVRRAFQESGLTIEEWNNLKELDREARLAKVIYTMRAEEESKTGL